MTKRQRSTDAKRAPLIDVAGDRLRALAEAGARGHALSPVEVRAVCEALRVQGQRVQTQFHSGV